VTRAQVRCTARMLNGFDCRSWAKVWVVRSRVGNSTIEPRCGNHGRHYATAWPLLTTDPTADRATAITGGTYP
jgi:hypothetical protein